MKTFIFIDSANIIYGAKATGRWKVDFEKLYDYLKNKYSATKIFYYTGYRENLPKDDFFIEDLRKIGYIVKAKPLKFIYQKPATFHIRCPKCLYTWMAKFSRPPIGKANCDVDLTMDALNESHNYEQAIIMSGDGDFLPLYIYLESTGKLIKIISESRMTAKLVRQHFQEKFTDLLSIKHIIQTIK